MSPTRQNDLLYSARRPDFELMKVKTIYYGIVIGIYILTLFIFLMLLIDFSISQLVLFLIFVIYSTLFSDRYISKAIIITTTEIKQRMAFKWRIIPIKEIKTICLEIHHYTKKDSYAITISIMDKLKIDENIVNIKEILNDEYRKKYLAGTIRIESYDVRKILYTLRSLFSMESWGRICDLQQTLKSINVKPGLWNIIQKYEVGNEIDKDERLLVEILSIYFGNIERVIQMKKETKVEQTPDKDNKARGK